MKVKLARPILHFWCSAPVADERRTKTYPSDPLVIVHQKREQMLLACL